MHEAPQARRLLFVSTHAVPHLPVPGGQISWHVLSLHVSPAGQMLPHVPQFAGSFLVSTHAVPHLVAPPLHISEHVLNAQV